MTANPAFKVLAYSIGNLVDVISEASGATKEAISDTTHRIYFNEYFNHTSISAKTIVVEYDYIDHDFLDDFAAYYVRCFEPYKRKCVRVHFFKTDFNEADFRSILGGDKLSLTESELIDSFLGFVVVRPLAHAPIGRTCLSTYNDDGGRRRYTNTQTCRASLYGIEMSVESLAFQQQDSVVSACATSALWSAFHATSKIFQHRQMSPVEITRQASEHSPVSSRVFPHSDGLQIEQMAHAIRKSGLEPLYIQGDSATGGFTPRTLKACIHAYVSFQLPVVMITELKTPIKTIGYHACTVTGTSLGGDNTPNGLTSDRIDEIYVHDDQVGPFARMKFKETGTQASFSTSWGVQHYKDVEAVPFALLGCVKE